MPKGVYPRKPGVKRIVPQKPIGERFWPKVEKIEAGCWQWIGMVDKAGYGRIRSGGGRAGESLYAHRVSVQLAGRVVPVGTELDHLCRNRSCVNPEHLEAVAHRQNFLRGSRLTARLHEAGVCANGHEAATNAYFRPGTTKVVYCKACRRNKRGRVSSDGREANE